MQQRKQHDCLLACSASNFTKNSILLMLRTNDTVFMN